MSNWVIQVESLGKKYYIGATARRHDTLGDRITALRSNLTNLFRPKLPSETVWAIKDVSFEVKRGEIIGIIGRNGAGKTTLLKILSRITDPTEGWAKICGRARSLLDIGTGFHRELTGRENIYLNGAILGMKQREIRRKFDEIVTFSEIEKFIDTPIKHYSSGMYVRLAFAVAAHLEPEILFIDEVLAVGDTAFQKKCLEKIGYLSGEGRTVLFVSHNMSAVQQLCSRAIWMDGGKICLEGPPSSMVEHYLKSCIQQPYLRARQLNSFSTIAVAYYDDVKLLDTDGKESHTFRCSSPMIIETRLRVQTEMVKVDCNIDILTATGTLVISVHSTILGYDPLQLTDGAIIRWNINELRLVPGTYFVSLGMRDSERKVKIDLLEGATSFEVLPADVFNTGQLIPSRGITYMPVSLETEHSLKVVP